MLTCVPSQTFHNTIWPEFWLGIYFGGLAVLRVIRQYFIRKISSQCDVIIIATS